MHQGLLLLFSYFFPRFDTPLPINFMEDRGSFKSEQAFIQFPCCSKFDLFLFFKQRYKENRWDPKRLIGSGGMPSSHSATVTALAVAIGFQDGFSCSLFATATIFASVVGYQFSIPTHVPSEEHKRFYFFNLD
jgi:hypothetical protein